jgi:hypothetical protein
MALIIPAKVEVFEEETQTGAAVSEAIGDKIGANLNHRIRYEEIRLQWVLNGQYDLKGVPDNYVDGLRAIPKSCRVAYCSVYNLNAGSSGSSRFDIVRFPSAGGPVETLLSVKPVIPQSVGNNAFIIKDVIDNVDIKLPVGCTAPEFLITELDAGDMVGIVMDQKQVGGENAGLELIIQTL